MNFIGRPTIHPLFFITGKAAGIITMIVAFLSAAYDLSVGSPFYPSDLLALTVFVTGLVLAGISLSGLGGSTRMGLPVEKTFLKVQGIYRFSRNPMYLGFHLMTLSSMLYMHTVLISGLGLYSLIIYHFIILGEERFLTAAFGDSYKNYCQKVHRYF
ncbi:hypothetical protein AUK40_06040 [Candidatus Wirthbacteria bacterium CG2_30_54_11]|uniref:Steroid 5-alpha reductase C-terminal domain-containing protein n=1 Tax=Candidatus Wirthbacteria bacterium CG2_30_54_11 TaxID=1817892 RepID=A0A1J5IE55_9BACT|nr:MAG: hypothetical protein AUK40_06040 [Candidatus Wirthbacteria bacterium CG2_30_54_11]